MELELDHLLSLEEDYWKTRSTLTGCKRVTEIRSTSTKKASQIQRRNSIEMVKTDDGMEVTDPIGV